MSNLLNFKHGFQAKLKENSPTIVPGTVYVTRDERALYVDLPPYDHGDGNIEAAKRVRIGDMRTYEYLSQLQEDLKNDMSNLTMSALYYAQKDNPTDNKVINALLKWDGSAFIQLNKTSDLTASLDTLENTVNGHTTLIESLTENVSNNYAKKSDVEATYAKKSDIEATYVTKTELNTAKADLLGDATNPSAETIRGVKKAVEAKQTLIESAQSTADGAVSALNTYKDQNDTALDAVRNTAKAAATNTDLQAEIKRSTEADAKHTEDLLAETTAREALGGRVETLELFFESADNSAEAIDKLREIQNYIASDKSGAAAMAGSIRANADAIETKASKDELATEVSARESAVANALTAAQEYTDTALVWGQF